MKRTCQPLWTTLASLIAAVAIPQATFAENIDPSADGSQYAYAENAGWINAQPLGPGGSGIEVANFELTGWMWGENTGWISLSCKNTNSCNAVAYGVTNNGEGVLSGSAWAENTGWIDFQPSTGGVKIVPSTGRFVGRAWSENAGWITFASSGAVAYDVKTSWCQGTAAAPAGSPALTLSKVGPDTQLSWPQLAGAAWYDVVRGDLKLLRSSSGDFTTATEECMADNVSGDPPSLLLTEFPDPGEGFWILVRGANCKGEGSYDTGALSQVGSRDFEIDASFVCP